MYIIAISDAAKAVSNEAEAREELEISATRKIISTAGWLASSLQNSSMLSYFFKGSSGFMDCMWLAVLNEYSNAFCISQLLPH